MIRIKQMVGYLKDYRFSSILLKYFLLLAICLVVPMTVLSIWYQSQLEGNMQEELINKNESALEVSYNNVNSVLKSMKVLACCLSIDKEVQYLAALNSVDTDNLESLNDMLSIVLSSNEYIDSVCIYLAKSGEVVSNKMVCRYSEYEDKDCFSLYSDDMPDKPVYEARKKKDRYPYLITILYPIRVGNKKNVGAVAVNIAVEKLGNYIGSGQYRNKDNTPMLMIFDGEMNRLMYSDEYRLLIDDASESNELRKLSGWGEKFSGIYTLWDKKYIVSGIYSSQDDLRYLYLSSADVLDIQNQSAMQIFRLVVGLILVVCLILAAMLTFWIYRPIQQTVKVLENASMLVDWDKKERVDEIEAIQRSILSAKKEKDYLDEQIQERILKLHNAQICALQTQINPHFLFNTLTGIGNAGALLLGKDNIVTDMIFTLGKLMRISLSSKEYLVPLNEELEHVKLYMKLIDFRYRGKVRMHVEIPDEIGKEQIAKLTLQPLIENAIEHGLAHRHSGGNIWLKGEKAGDNITIYVVDDGEGIGQKELYKLRERLKESAVGGSEHIGLKNVNQRLKLIFGDEDGLEVNREEEGGLCVTVRFRTL